MGKGYASDGLFVMNVQNNVVDKFDDNNRFTFTTYFSFSIRHARLGNVNYYNVKRMIDFKIIREFLIDLDENYI